MEWALGEFLEIRNEVYSKKSLQLNHEIVTTPQNV